MQNSPDDRKRRATEPLADAEILRRLTAEGFDPRRAMWVELSGALAEYGYDVFIGRLMAGTVYRMAAGQGSRGVLGLSRLPRELKLPHDDAHELTAGLLEVAIPRFLGTLRAGLWHPDGGASLRTFFIGRCLMELPDAYERWHRQQERWAQAHADPADVDDGRFSLDPAAAALDAVELDELLPRAEFEHVRVMLLLAEYGYTTSEISELFTKSGMRYTEATVRTRISRARARARARHDRNERGEGDGR
jgi:DNA-directed RNA polymerase specialized sigma24 family protein